MEDNFNELILKSMPHFIAAQYKLMLDSSTAEEKVGAALHTYELGLRTLALATISSYLMRDYDKISDHELNQLLETKLPNASLNIWQRLFFLGLKAYGGHRDLLFVKELHDLYWDSSVEPHVPRTDVAVPFTRLTQIRNTIAWGNKPSDEHGWQALYEECAILLRQILGHFDFLQNYELIRIVKREGHQYWFESHTGINAKPVSVPLETDQELQVGWFYLSKGRKDFLKLHPLMISWEDVVNGIDVAVYDRYIREDNVLQYLTTTLWRKILDDTNVIDFIRMLYTTLDDYKRGHESSRRLTWWKLQEVGESISQRQMTTDLGKHRAELYLQREHTREAFENFLTSDKVCFVLTGKSGVGKSNFVLALAEEFRKQQSRFCLLVYHGAKLDPAQSIMATVSRDFDRYIRLGEKTKIEDIWQEIALIEDIDERKVVLIFDAINENPHAKELLIKIDQLVTEANWPWLKVVITSRPEAWRGIRHRVAIAEARYYRDPGSDRMEVELEPFSYSEQLEPFSRDELPRVYEKYRTVFHLQTTYEDLPRDVRRALRDPLLLLLVSETYRGETLPPLLRTIEIYKSYLDGLVRTGRLQPEDLRFLTQELIPLMVREGYYSNTITAKQIDTAVTSDNKPLFELIHNDGLLEGQRQVNQSYVNLGDAGILALRGTALDYAIGFRYERFYDYFVGSRLFDLNASAADKSGAYVAQIGLIRKQQYLWGAIKLALILELRAGAQNSILELSRSSDYSVHEIVTATLKEYGLENPAEVHDILLELMKNKTLPTLGARRIAVDVAGTLGFSDILADGASDSSSLRLDAIRQIFYLWRNDRIELPSTLQNRGLSALRKLGHRTKGRLGLPQTPALESAVGISVSLFLEMSNDPTLAKELRMLWRQIIDGLLYTNTRFGRTLLRVVAGDRASSVFINFASRITAETPRYYLGDINEFRAFFELPAEEKRWLRMIIPYLDPNYGRIEELGDLMKRVFQNDDLLTAGFLALALVSQGRKRPADIVPIIADLFEYVMSLSPRGVPAHQYLSGALYEVLRRQDRIDDETWKLVDRFVQVPMDKTRGMLISRTGKQYFSVGCLYPCVLYSEKQGHPGLHLWKNYLTLAFEEENWDMLGDLLYLAGEIAIPFHFPNAALAILRGLSIPPNAEATRRILGFLVRVRLYYPDLVDEFLESEDFPEHFVSNVRSAIANESIIQIVFSRFISYLVEALQTAPFRDLCVSVLDKAVECSTVDEWLIFLTRKLTNTIHGSQIFPIDE